MSVMFSFMSVRNARGSGKTNRSTAASVVGGQPSSDPRGTLDRSGGAERRDPVAARRGDLAVCQLPFLDEDVLPPGEVTIGRDGEVDGVSDARVVGRLLVQELADIG